MKLSKPEAYFDLLIKDASTDIKVIVQHMLYGELYNIKEYHKQLYALTDNLVNEIVGIITELKDKKNDEA